MAPLDDFHDLASITTDLRILVVGDSVPGTGSDHLVVWPVQLRAILEPSWGAGGIGYLGVWRPEWTELGGDFTRPAAYPGVAYNRAPWGEVWEATGAANVARCTLPEPCSTCELYYVDKAGTSTPSYRLDGGAWVNFGGTYAGANLLRKVTVTNPASTTIDVRAANAAGTDAPIVFAGLRHNLTPGEVVIDNLGYPSIGLGRFATGDMASFLALEPPDLVIVNESNDAIVATEPAWTTNMEAIWAAVPNASKMLVTVPEQNLGRDTVIQARYRERTKNIAKAAGAYVLDMAAFWGTTAEGQALGFWEAFAVHPNEAGYADFASRIAAVLTRPRLGAGLAGP